LLSEAEQALDQVDEALERLDQGTYGTCELCGGPIDEGRLSELPTIRSCADHPRLTDPIGEVSLPGTEPGPGSAPQAYRPDPSADSVSERLQ
jgi:hypothetical protein